MKELFSNRYVVAFSVPLMVLAIGVLAKKLIRGKHWQRDDFYLGVELMLAAIAGDLDYLFDLVGTGRLASPPLVFLVGALVFLFVLVSEHQDLAKAPSSWKQIVRLCVISNVVGGGFLVTLILVVKGLRVTR